MLNRIILDMQLEKMVYIKSLIIKILLNSMILLKLIKLHFVQF